ncbi:MAG: efflux RND transporter periplasmic adaptor subunit [Rhodocyclaceae bacterium]|nr:efflux RND transporter periplasmic adaptor subunit [Rhodocyclaceae bacterium]
MRRIVPLLALAALPVLAQQTAQPAAVSAKIFKEIVLHPEREAPASAVSLNESRLSAEVTATVKEVAFDVGQVAPKGAVLIRLETRDYELALAKSQAALDSSRARARLAEQQLNRARELAKQNFYSAEALTQKETELAVQQAQVKLDEAQLAQARRNLEKCTLRAPFQAIVRSRQAQVGELAAPGAPLMTLSEATRVEVAAQVPPRDIASLQGAGEVRFIGSGGEHPVKLLRVSPAISREARTVDVRLAFAGKPAAPGSDGRILWRDPQPHLPAELVSKRGAAFGVFVLEGGIARFVPLPGAQEGRPVAAPMLADKSIVVDGRHGLADGQAVQAAK